MFGDDTEPERLVVLRVLRGEDQGLVVTEGISLGHLHHGPVEPASPCIPMGRDGMDRTDPSAASVQNERKVDQTDVREHAIPVHCHERPGNRLPGGADRRHRRRSAGDPLEDAVQEPEHRGQEFRLLGIGPAEHAKSGEILGLRARLHGASH